MAKLSPVAFGRARRRVRSPDSHVGNGEKRQVIGQSRGVTAFGARRHDSVPERRPWRVRRRQLRIIGHNCNPVHEGSSNTVIRRCRRGVSLGECKLMNITFRTQLLGGVTDFCSEIGLSLATPEVLVDLVVRLARYQEEGVKLAPQVYLTDDIDLLINMLPGGEKLFLSLTTADACGIEEMLKICAPLATGEWKIFGHQCSEGMKFGVFRGSDTPISVSVDDIVLTAQEQPTVIKAHQVAEECVQVSSSKGFPDYPRI